MPESNDNIRIKYVYVLCIILLILILIRRPKKAKQNNNKKEVFALNDTKWCEEHKCNVSCKNHKDCNWNCPSTCLVLP